MGFVEAVWPREPCLHKCSDNAIERAYCMKLENTDLARLQLAASTLLCFSQEQVPAIYSSPECNHNLTNSTFLLANKFSRKAVRD